MMQVVNEEGDVVTYHQLLRALLDAGITDPDKYLRTPLEVARIEADYQANNLPQRKSVARWLFENPTDGRRADLDKRKMTP